jgi:alpha-pyrone synthase
MNHSQTSGSPRIVAIASAVPENDVHALYTDWAERQVADVRVLPLYRRMAARSGIAHRFSVLGGADYRMEPGSFYASDTLPPTSERMRRYAEAAPALSLRAIAGLGPLDQVTHLVVASCTGFTAPGLDQVLARRLGLAATVERVMIGFMGCYAGVTALRTAGHIVRAQPHARVLVVAAELCTLHMQMTGEIESLLAMGQFADGAAAALVCGDGAGLALGEAVSLTLEDSADLITWTIGDSGFTMVLSGEVPARIADALADRDVQARIAPDGAEAIGAWAVHPGGRSILDSVERAYALPAEKLAASRAVLHDNGNMSSATVLFVLERLLAERPASGIALAFGPGLALEGLRFGWTGDAG